MILGDRSVAAGIAGALGTVVAVSMDVLMFGGDALVALAIVLATDVTVLVSLVTYLERLAERVAYLPADIVSSVAEIVLIVAVTILILRLLASWNERRQS